jgi:hypothetical protein
MTSQKTNVIADLAGYIGGEQRLTPAYRRFARKQPNALFSAAAEITETPAFSLGWSGSDFREALEFRQSAVSGTQMTLPVTSTNIVRRTPLFANGYFGD